LASQPLVYCPSQSAHGAVQPATPQTPPAQSGAPLATVHTTLQPPQVATLFDRLASQPSAGEPLQSENGAVHEATPHAPPAQSGVPLATLHARPQLPQLVTLVSTLVSQPSAVLPLQSRKTPEHAPTPQVPPAQTAVPLDTEQARPQAPQCARLSAVLASQPSTTEPLQSLHGATQLATVHWRFTHAGVPFCAVHEVEQLPHVATSEFRLASQPSA
jgi:hypothetical protein